MDKTDKKADRSTWVIGGMTLVGLGVGLILLQTSALLFIAAVLIGIGLGIVIASIISGENS